MASKRFKNQTCAYCGQPGISAAGDHVVARSFFLEERRHNLPIVPACAPCNQDKSILEHYLATILPFGGRHADALTHLREKVEGRLAKNIPLAGAIYSSRHAVWRAVDHRTWTIDHSRMAIDQRKLLDLCCYIAKGLAYHHWRLVCPDETSTTYATYLAPDGVRIVDPFFRTNNEHTLVRGDLGAGTFWYEGVRDQASPLNIWRMSIFGAQLTGDPRAPKVIVDKVYVFVGPTSMQSFRDFVVGLGAVLPDDMPAARPTDSPQASDILAQPSTVQDET